MFRTHREPEQEPWWTPPPPPGAEECASSHRVHRLLVTFPYASEVGTLITSACDSRAAEVEEEEEEKPRMKGAGRRGGAGGGLASPAVLGDDHFVAVPVGSYCEKIDVFHHLGLCSQFERICSEAQIANWILMTLIFHDAPLHTSVSADKRVAPQLSRPVNPPAFFFFEFIQ